MLWRTDRQTDGRTDICSSWAAFAAEKMLWRTDRRTDGRTDRRTFALLGAAFAAENYSLYENRVVMHLHTTLNIKNWTVFLVTEKGSVKFIMSQTVSTFMAPPYLITLTRNDQIRTERDGRILARWQFVVDICIESHISSTTCGDTSTVIRLADDDNNNQI